MTGDARLRPDAVQLDRSELRPANWPTRESDSQAHRESEQSSSRRLNISSGRGNCGEKASLEQERVRRCLWRQKNVSAMRRYASGYLLSAGCGGLKPPHPWVRSRTSRVPIQYKLSASPAGFARGSPRGSPHRFPLGLPSDRFLFRCSLLLCCRLFLVSSNLLLLNSKPLFLGGELLLQLTDFCRTLFLHRYQLLPQRGLLLAGFLSDLRNSCGLLSRGSFLLCHSLRRLPFCSPGHDSLLTN